MQDFGVEIYPAAAQDYLVERAINRIVSQKKNEEIVITKTTTAIIMTRIIIRTPHLIFTVLRKGPCSF